jgi:NAD(P)-dependent dehydrogenase (short-subunit alcohol dehydrogenase family)
MKTLKNRVAVITGAGSGIGRALALLLAQHGCRVAAADINEDSAAETAAIVRHHGVPASAHQLDVADKNAMQAFPGQVIDQFGAVHIVVNNAGVTVAATVEEHSIEDYEWLMGINFWGVLYGTKFFLPHLRQVDEAHIVNISSVFGLIAVPNQSSYNAAKFAVRGFTESLRQELAGSSIGVSCVHPGGVKTNIVRAARYVSLPSGQAHDEATESFAKMARLTPEAAARQIVRAIKKRTPRVLVGTDAAVLDLMQRLFPRRYDRVVARVTAKL